MLKTVQHLRLDPAERYGAQLGAFAMAAQNSPMPAVITDSTAPGIPVAFANDAFLAMTGHSRNALLASPIETLFGEVADGETLDLLENTAANGGTGMWKLNVQRANESTFLAMVYLSPIFTDDGKIINHIINVFDIGSLLCMSKDREEIYPALYDRAPGFIALTDGADHRFTYANAAYKSFVRRDELIGKTVAEALPEIMDQGIIAILDEVYQTGKPFLASNMPICVKDPDLETTDHRWVDSVYQPVRDESGAITGLFCSGHDVTDLRDANRALAALQLEMTHVSQVNAMGTMAAMLAHELNQPLTAISNYLAGVRPLGGSAPDVGRLSVALEGIRGASERAVGIIDHVRQLTKHRQPSRKPFNLKSAVEECIRLVRSSCRAEITFENRVASNLTMSADLVKIQQVLINLLQNACDAMADTVHPVVTIDAVEGDQHLTVCVTDTGSGVSPEAVATMFAWMESSKSDGMGIGLSICRTIIELHRGSIWLEQTGPQGSQFRFSVPVPEAEAAPESDRESRGL